MALHKSLLKKRLKYWHPLPPKTSYCDKTIGSRELIFGTIHIKKCMNNLEFFQPNLRWSSGEFSFNCPVWRGMTHTHTHTHTQTKSQINIHTHAHSLRLTLTVTNTHTHTHTHSL